MNYFRFLKEQQKKKGIKKGKNIKSKRRKKIKRGKGKKIKYIKNTYLCCSTYNSCFISFNSYLPDILSVGSLTLF